MFFFDYDDDVSDKDDNKDRAKALVLNGIPFAVEIKESEEEIDKQSCWKTKRERGNHIIVILNKWLFTQFTLKSHRFFKKKKTLNEN